MGSQHHAPHQKHFPRRRRVGNWAPAATQPIPGFGDSLDARPWGDSSWVWGSADQPDSGQRAAERNFPREKTFPKQCPCLPPPPPNPCRSPAEVPQIMWLRQAAETPSLRPRREPIGTATGLGPSPARPLSPPRCPRWRRPVSLGGRSSGGESRPAGRAWEAQVGERKLLLVAGHRREVTPASRNRESSAAPEKPRPALAAWGMSDRVT